MERLFFANKYRNVECDVSVLMKRAIKQNVWTWRSSLFVPHTRTCPQTRHARAK